MLLPTKGDVPRWYELGLMEDGLMVSADPIIKAMFSLVLDHPEPKEKTRTLKIPVFIPPTPNGAWGHGSVLKPVAAKVDRWLAWECKWPSVQQLHFPYEAWAVSASLRFLFLMLMAIKKKNAPMA